MRLAALLVIGGTLSTLSGRSAAQVTSVKVAGPVEIVTARNKPSTSVMLVEMTWTNGFDRPLTCRTDDLPQFAIYDAAGHSVDSFLVETKPKEGEEQTKAEPLVVTLKPKESYTRKVKVWVRALALEPGRCYQLGTPDGELKDKAPFVATVTDGRSGVKSRAYDLTVRLRVGESEKCGVVFDVDAKKGVAYALTVLKEKPELVWVQPLYYRVERSATLYAYDGEPVKGTARVATNGVAVAEFPLAVSKDLTLRPEPLPLEHAGYRPGEDTYLVCGWSPGLGVYAPCAAVLGSEAGAFSTIYATPRTEWQGSGCFSHAGRLVGLCSHAGTGHRNRVGYYAGVSIIHTALNELGHKIAYAPKKSKE